MQIGAITVIVAVVSFGLVAGETSLDVENYVQIFTPYRNVLRKSFNNLFTDKDPPRQPRADYLTCDVCRTALPLIKGLLRTGTPTELIIITIINLCVVLEIETLELCNPTIRAYANPVLHILKARPNYTAPDLCGILNRDCGVPQVYLTDWDIQIDNNKPLVETLPPLNKDIETVKILHITDVHIDVNYTVGTDAGCGKPLCCREGVPEYDNTTAGIYGHHSCALPPLALHEMYRHAKETHQEIKYIFLTGDYTHSGVWLYSQAENGRNIRAVTEALAKSFPDVPIYPLVGNHEPDVVNMYPPQELWGQFDLTWMYDTVSRPFRKWLGSAQLETFNKGGYYTLSPERGLRIVALNTNICYLNNFWLAYDPVDPTGQLQWFAKTMLQAEQNGDHVLILGHIVPGSGSCWTIWSDKFDKIMNRFGHLVRGQFYGHSHTESFVLTFERGTEKPMTGVSYVGPSAVTDGMNSGYRIYNVDGARGMNSTWEIVDYETWILNITESNEMKTPMWEKLYTAREDFGITSLRGEELYQFVLKMVLDDELFRKFQWYHNKGLTTRGFCGDGRIEEDEEEEEDFRECKMGLLCDLVTAYSGDDSHCERIKAWNGTVVTTTTTEKGWASPSSQMSSILAVLLFTVHIFAKLDLLTI